MSNKISVLQSFFVRQQPRQSSNLIIKAGIGGVIAIATLALLSQWTDSLWLMAPFGCGCMDFSSYSSCRFLP